VGGRRDLVNSADEAAARRERSSGTTAGDGFEVYPSQCQQCDVVAYRLNGDRF
jgi:hypothetical protein